jgi:hypothetical protein
VRKKLGPGAGGNAREKSGSPRGGGRIKITPFVGPMIDIIAHCSDFVAKKSRKKTDTAENRTRDIQAFTVAA